MAIPSDFQKLLDSLPRIIEPEFVMPLADEPIRLTSGRFTVREGLSTIGAVDGDLRLEWIPTPAVRCIGTTEIPANLLFGSTAFEIADDTFGFSAACHTSGLSWGQPSEVRLLPRQCINPRFRTAEFVRFYLVNFPDFLGEVVRTGSGERMGWSRSRLHFRAGDLVFTIDRIEASDAKARSVRPGFALSHVGELRSDDGSIDKERVMTVLDALHWFLAFMRGARTGPILPSTDVVFAKSWISIGSWRIDEAREVESWLPTRSPLDLGAIFEQFLEKWQDRTWQEGIRTVLAWYIAANAPGTPNEARIALCQMSLITLATLHGFEDDSAEIRIARLCTSLGLPLEFPQRYPDIRAFGARVNKPTFPACLTFARNKLEHPEHGGWQALESLDGTARMELAQRALESIELLVLLTLGYAGKYSMRRFKGWKGDDEVSVPGLI